MDKTSKLQTGSGQSNQPNGMEVTKTAGSSAGSDSSSHSTASSHKRQHSKDSTENSSTSQHISTHLNSSQSHPKKKGGFVITSVKDNVDGDESADDLDESHASYSDISYSKTADIDHDQESSTSDETMNVTSPDGSLTSNNLPHNIVQPSRQALNSSERKRSDSLKQVKANNPKLPVQDLKGLGELGSNIKNESQSVQAGGMQTSGYSSELSSSNASQSNINQNQGQFKVPVTSKPPNPSLTNVSTVTSAITAARTGSSSSTTTSKGGSRVYKVVKRETGQPTRRESARWVCFDYGDVQAPNLGFVVPSASDSRINAHDQSQIHSNQLPLSLSATSVPSSASAYSLQHSDSTSSIHRDIIHSYGASAASNTTVQHSASASSVNYDAEGRKLSKSTKSGSESLENSGNDRFPKITADQDLQNVILSSSELSSAPETEDERSFSSALKDLSVSQSFATNVRIDNKIEAAMDLVKKHLMQAVRDEVDELKERIVELEQDVDVMKGVLTPAQMAQIRPALSSKFVKYGIGTLSSLNQSGQASAIGHGTSVHLAHDTTVTSQQQSGHTHIGHSLSSLPQKPNVLTNPSSRAVNPSSVATQAKSVPQNVAGEKPNNAQISHPPQSSQHQLPAQMSRPGSYQQGSAVFQPIAQSSAPSQPQLTAQQIQAMRQQAYQQISGGSQPGFQSPQVVLQQSNLTSSSQQSQIATGSVIQPGHASYPQQTAHLPPHGSNLPQQTPVTAAMGQPQYVPTTQPSLNRMSSVGGQGTGPVIPRTGQPTSSVTTSTGSALPSMHTQSTFQPVSVPPLYTTPQGPHSNTNNTIENKASQT